MDKIDFVVLWVDGSDINWLNEKKLYDKRIIDPSSSASRFRDWNNMQYWFRGVEKYAPWVNRIYFVTWGHLPSWLRPDHPKIRIVRHTDFIPSEYLPTYNSNTIELNLHRISELSEHFVLFNDDMFVIKDSTETDFFIDGKPCDEFVLNAIVPHYDMPIIGHTCLNNVGIINRNFKKSDVMRKYLTKIVNPKYGSGVLRTLLLLPWNAFVGFHNTHIPQSHLKSVFEMMWELEGEKLHETCLNRFRGLNDLSHWLMRYWNLCNGDFVPRRSDFGRLFNISNHNERIVDCIINQKANVICVNDMNTDFDFEIAVREVNHAFETILPRKSSFER